MRSCLGWIIAVSVCGLLVTGLLGCGAQKRHRILCFFFDDVPPLGSNSGDLSLDANDVSPAAGSEPSSRRRGENRFVHEPYQDCSTCHGDGVRVTASGGIYLTQSVPQLCIQCHRAFDTPQPYVHGPVAVGDCLFCHEPHITRIKGLLKKPLPDLCFQCHDEENLIQIAAHPHATWDKCRECHEDHMSSARYLLKTNPETPPVDPNAVDPNDLATPPNLEMPAKDPNDVVRPVES
ncbi:cytochrome c3 family protein [Planctomycetota bacterium]